MIKGIEHAAICARDSESLKDWYITVLGFKQVYDNRKGTYFLKVHDGGLIEFIPASEQHEPAGVKAIGIRHLALTVDDFEVTVIELLKKKVSVVFDPMVSTIGVKTFFFKDPEGNLLHLVWRPEPLLNSICKNLPV